MTAMTDEEVRQLIATVPYSYNAMEVRPGSVTPGTNAANLVMQYLHPPDDYFEVVSSRLFWGRGIVNCQAVEDADRQFHNALARGRR